MASKRFSKILAGDLQFSFPECGDCDSVFFLAQSVHGDPFWHDAIATSFIIETLEYLQFDDAVFGRESGKVSRMTASFKCGFCQRDKPIFQ